MGIRKKLEKILKSMEKGIENTTRYSIRTQEPIKIIQEKYPRLTEDECKRLLNQKYRLERLRKIRRYQRT